MSRNIKLAYIITALYYCWFWAAVWILFYLKFTDYAGIGLLETIMIATAVFGEIPTGAIADLIGKKHTLTLAFLLGSIGNIVMGSAAGFSLLALGVIIATVGHVLTSGTFEALVYDTLLSEGKESTYQKVLSNISSIKMLSLAVASIVGGFLYRHDPALPFYLVGIFQLLALVASLKLTEPAIDSYTFSWQQYKRQTIAGFQELVKTQSIAIQSCIIIAMTALTAMNGHMLIDAQLVGLNWSEQQLGVIVSIMYVLSAVIGQTTSFFTQRWGSILGAVFAAIVIATTMIAVPYAPLILATALVVFRNGSIEVFGNSASETINTNTRSQYRATTLSTYSMLANMPYILGAFYIGRLIDIYSIHDVVFVIGLVLLAVSTLSFVLLRVVASRGTIKI